MRFELKPGFRRAYRKRVGNNIALHKRIGERIELFRTNRTFPLLHDHALKGTKEGLRSFSVTGDIRIIYCLENNTAYFVDIGTHNQVY